MAKENNQDLLSEANAETEALSGLQPQNWQSCMDFVDEPIIIVAAQTNRIQFMNKAATDFLGLKHSIEINTHLDHCFSLQNSSTQQPISLSETLNDGHNGLVDFNRVAELIAVDGEPSSINFRSSVKGLIPGFIVLSFYKPESQNSSVIEITEASTVDELTGLEVRGCFERDLQLALKLCLKNKQQHVAGKIKVAHLNTINELCGSVAGDELLRQLTEIIHQKLFEFGTLYRLTESEFGFLMDNIKIEDTINIVQDILDSIKQHKFEWAGKPLPVSVNVGITSITNATDNWLSLMAEMDAACQAAVSESDNFYKIFSTEDKQISQNHSEMGLISTIISALQNDRLVLYVQKIVPVSKNNNVPHIEMLIRMYGENDELLAPGLFLGAAETYNLILMIDKWVVTNTLKWLEENQSWLDPKLVCNINLSGFSIGQQNFKEFLLNAINATTIKANKLCFEITETAAIKDFSKANTFISAVKETGAFFALDDFGSGMCSFAYLKNLKVDILKIDGTLIRHLDQDSFDKVMVQSICQIARVMGLSTVAEFVENEEILKQLEFLGVDYAQGFHLCKPMPLSEYQQQQSASD
jgi:Amt family ammonium transporter